MPKDLRTKAFILRRTNYGEANRILTFITPEGKFSAMAKSVRREKSKLAGGIELFCLSDIVIHQGKDEFGIVTSAKLLKYYQNIVTDVTKLELGSLILKKINQAAETIDSPEFFSLTEQALEAIDKNYNLSLIESWFLFNLARVKGEVLNIHRDVSGNKLEEGQTYVWNSVEEALEPKIGGNIGKNEIKLMRLMIASKLEIVEKVKNIEGMLPSVLYIARSVIKA